MSGAHGTSRSRASVALAVAALALAGTALALRFDTGALPAIGRYGDDAYHYFTWARSVVNGNGPVVSDGVPTSGVHLGHACVVVVLCAMFGAAALESAVQLAGLGLHLLTAWLVGGAVPRREPWLRLACAAAYASSPFLLTHAQNGQGTSLAALALVVLIRARAARWPWFAIAAVAAVFARSDLLLFVVALSALRREAWWRRLLWPALALAAYAAWNTALAGHPLQDSVAPMPWLVADRFERSDPDPAERLGRWWFWFRPVLLGGPFATASVVGAAALVAVAASALVRGLPSRLRTPARLAALPMVGVAALLAVDDLAVPAVAAVWWAALPRAGPVLRRPAVALLGGAVLLVFAHDTWRCYPRDYYFAPIAVAGLWLVASCAGRFGPRAARLALLGVLAGHALELRVPAPQRPWQEAMVMAGRFADRFVPTGARIGCFNAGIVAWHRPNVVGLDGIVDRGALDALRAGRLGAFLDARDVRFVLDHPVQFEVGSDAPHACGDYFGAGFDPRRDLRELARFVVPGVDAGRPGTGWFALYARGAAGASTAAPRIADLGPAPGGGRWVAWRGEPGAELHHGPRGDPQRAVAVARADSAGVVHVLALRGSARPCAVFESGVEVLSW